MVVVGVVVAILRRSFDRVRVVIGVVSVGRRSVRRRLMMLVRIVLVVVVVAAVLMLLLLLLWLG